ncbi:MAG: DUF2330 domain-containing protein [Ferruginibacter sp.]
MKRKLLIIGAVIAIAPILFSFCGFYVSKADGTLKNKTSQVILVRDGNKTIITMYNDFKGDTKDFAMVVPVPVVLQKNDVHVVDQSIFQRLNDYSAPRLVEYWDQNPCDKYEMVEDKLSGRVPGVSLSEVTNTSAYKKKDLGVKVEAQYVVGEYDILILSAKESGGLKEWLTSNGYKIPEGAAEVLDPYIKSNLKFFVVKVNEKEKQKLNNDFLRPIQIRFNSPKFMLPIRLGMANADGDQDLIVYAFTRKGRIECTNYRNVNMPTDNKVPLFVQKNFGSFYGNLFTHQWDKEDKSVAFLEYAWDVSPQNYYHCDPCIATAPSEQDLVQSGVWWMAGKDWTDYSDVDGDEPDDGSKNVHFTRLHFRYNRKSFAQDLMFQVTPNTETFQARYVITHPATGSFTCDAGKKYLQDLKKRRKQELEELMVLTGTNINNWQEDASAKNDEETVADAQYASLLPIVDTENNTSGRTGLLVFSALLLGSAGFLKWKGFV